MSRKESYQKYIGLKSIFYFCSLPLRLDSYRGCNHGCLYCFSERLNNRKKCFNRKIIPANPTNLDRIMSSLKKNGRKGAVRSCLSRKVPIHFGCVSDPLQSIEKKMKITKIFLEILHNYEYPFVLCTKSCLVSEKPYISIFKDSHCSIQMSFSTFNKNLARRLEPNAPDPTTRLHSMEKLANLGIFTVARLQPFLYPRERLTNNILRRFANAGIKHIVLEHLRIPTNSSYKSRNLLWQALGKNMISEYRRLGLKCSRVSYELSSEAKIDNIIFCRNEAHKLGMTFGSGDNDFHHVSDSLCCCGIPNTKEFLNIYSGHIGAGIFMAMKERKLLFNYINKEWHPKGGIRENVNSQCRISQCHTTLDLIKHKISNGGSNSPLSFYGIEKIKNGSYIINRKKMLPFWEEKKNDKQEKNRLYRKELSGGGDY